MKRASACMDPTYFKSGQALNTATASREEIWLAAQEIYAKHPELLEAARRTLFGK